jgi:hypothetical protein
VTLFGSGSIQRQGRLAVARYASAAQQQVGEIILSPIESGLGRAPVTRGGLDEIDGHAPAEFMAPAQHVDRWDMARVGCDRKPSRGGATIAGNSTPIEQYLAEGGLSLHQPEPGGGL